MILHIFCKPLSDYVQQQLIIAENDSILLISDACYSASHFASQYNNCDVYALETDIKARGIEHPTVKLISDEQWVTLVVQSEQHITW